MYMHRNPLIQTHTPYRVSLSLSPTPGWVTVHWDLRLHFNLAELHCALPYSKYTPAVKYQQHLQQAKPTGPHLLDSFQWFNDVFKLPMAVSPVHSLFNALSTIATFTSDHTMWQSSMALYTNLFSGMLFPYKNVSDRAQKGALGTNTVNLLKLVLLKKIEGTHFQTHPVFQS